MNLYNKTVDLNHINEKQEVISGSEWKTKVDALKKLYREAGEEVVVVKKYSNRKMYIEKEYISMVELKTLLKTGQKVRILDQYGDATVEVLKKMILHLPFTEEQLLNFLKNN